MVLVMEFAAMLVGLVLLTLLALGGCRRPKEPEPVTLVVTEVRPIPLRPAGGRSAGLLQPAPAWSAPSWQASDGPDPWAVRRGDLAAVDPVGRIAPAELLARDYQTRLHQRLRARARALHPETIPWGPQPGGSTALVPAGAESGWVNLPAAVQPVIGGGIIPVQARAKPAGEGLVAISLVLAAAPLAGRRAVVHVSVE